MCLYTALKHQGNTILWTGNWGLMTEALFSSCESCIVAALNLPEKILRFIFLFITTILVYYLSGLKETGSLPFVVGKSSDSTVSNNQGNNRYGSQHSQNTLPWYIFPWNGIVFPKSVFTQFGNCRETSFGETDNWGLIPKYDFPLLNLDSCSFNPARKTHWFIFLFIKQQLWLCIWVLWKKQAVCHFMLGVIWQYSFTLSG